MVQTPHSISVVICTYTEERWHNLVAVVESVQQQTVLPTEIIIVIDYNTRLLQRVQEQIANVHVIGNQQAKGLSGARNTGAAIAQAEVVAFVDDDAVAEPDWIEQLIICYTNPHVLGVGGKIEPHWFNSRPSWFPNEFDWVVGCTYRGVPTTNAPVRNMIGANMSVRRHILITADGFREAFGWNDVTIREHSKLVRHTWFKHHVGDEETEFCIRVAQQWPDGIWLYTPFATVHHHVPAQRTRLSYFLWRCFHEGLGKATLANLHGIQTGLSSERTYIFKTLPQGIVRGFTSALLHHDATGLARAGTISLGLATTITGYLIGSVLQWTTKPRNSTALNQIKVRSILPIGQER